MEALNVLRTKTEGAYRWIIDKSMLLFGATEQLNRIATIAGTYLALKDQAQGQPFNPERALERAKHASDRSHGTYGRVTHPYAAQGKNPFAQTAKCFYVFSKFTHTYLQNMYEIGFKKKNAKALTYMLFAPAVLAGGPAIPVVWPAIMGALAKLFDVDEPEEQVYAWIGDHFGELAGEFTRSGALGMGGRGITLEGSMGVDVIGGIPTTLPELFGAPASVVMDVYWGGKDVLKGRTARGIETMAPTAVGSAMKAVREHREGVTTRGGVPKMLDGRRMQPTMTDSILRFLNFNPAHVAAMKDRKWSQTQLIRKYRQKRSDIYAKLRSFYQRPTEERGQADLADILADIQEYNDRVIEGELAQVEGISVITRDSVRTALLATD